ncbi:MAG: hypothetical protein PT957_00550 [Firmicutes bacterium]|nr:hypothetical protein [Bacillota bacterium]
MRPTISSGPGITISTSTRKINPNTSLNDEIVRVVNPAILQNHEKNRVWGPDILPDRNFIRVENHPDNLPNHKYVRAKHPVKSEIYKKSRAKKGPAFSLKDEFVRVENPDILTSYENIRVPGPNILPDRTFIRVKNHSDFLPNHKNVRVE